MASTIKKSVFAKLKIIGTPAADLSVSLTGNAHLEDASLLRSSSATRKVLQPSIILPNNLEEEDMREREKHKVNQSHNAKIAQ